MFLNHVEVAGRALVRCPVLDEDPGGTEHVWVIWSRLSASTQTATDSHRQTDQSRLETKARSVLFLPANEREEFSINLFHLVLRGRYTKQSVRWIRWVGPPSPPPLGAPWPFPQNCWRLVCSTVKTCVCTTYCSTHGYYSSRVSRRHKHVAEVGGWRSDSIKSLLLHNADIKNTPTLCLATEQSVTRRWGCSKSQRVMELL